MVRQRGYQPKKRNANNRREKRIFLLAAEGKNKTEQNYFSHFKNDNIAIRFVRGNYTDPVQMTKRLLEDYDEYGLTGSDYAACFVDSDFDVKKDAQLERADKLLKKNKKR